MTRDSNVTDVNFSLGLFDSKYEQKFSPYFSERNLIRNQVKVEVFWLAFLIEHLKNTPKLSEYDYYLPQIFNIYDSFSTEDYNRVKKLRKTTNEDVKAVELYVAEELKELELDDLESFVHIGCTDEDITNIAYANLISEAVSEVWVKRAEEMIDKISKKTVKKEIPICILKETLGKIKSIKCKANFNIAMENYSAIAIALQYEYGQVLIKHFIEDYMGLEYSPISTQNKICDYLSHIADSIYYFDNVMLYLVEENFLNS